MGTQTGFYLIKNNLKRCVYPIIVYLIKIIGVPQNIIQRVLITLGMVISVIVVRVPATMCDA